MSNDRRKAGVFDGRPPAHGLTRRQLLQRGLLAGGVAVLGPAALAACGSSSTPSSAQGQKGGTLTTGLFQDIVNFDPYNFLSVSFPLLRNLNGYLLRYDDKLAPMPDLASRFEIAKDRASVTVQLRDGLKFQTGNPITAADVLHGLERAADPARGLQMNGSMNIVEKFTSSGEHEVTIKFKHQVTDLMITDLLASMPVVDRKFNDAESLATKPASAGPFQLGDWKPGNSVTLKRFDGYWNSPQPLLDTVVFKFFSDPEAMLAALQSNVVGLSYRIPEKDGKRIESQFNLMQGYPGALVHCLRMNPNVAPYDNIKVRQAIQRALNRELMVQTALTGFGKATVLPWGSNSPAYDPSYDEKYKFDLDAAAALLREAGSPKGGEALDDPGTPQTGVMLQILQSDLKKIGFDLTIKSMDSKVVGKMISSGQFGMAFNGLGNCQKSPWRISTNSIFRIKDNPVWKDKLPAEYVAAIEASMMAVTPTAAKAAYDRLNRVITDEAAGCPVAYDPYLAAYSKQVQGVARSVDNELLLGGASL